MNGNPQTTPSAVFPFSARSQRFLCCVGKATRRQLLCSRRTNAASGGRKGNLITLMCCPQTQALGDCVPVGVHQAVHVLPRFFSHKDCRRLLGARVLRDENIRCQTGKIPDINIKGTTKKKETNSDFCSRFADPPPRSHWVRQW